MQTIKTRNRQKEAVISTLQTETAAKRDAKQTEEKVKIRKSVEILNFTSKHRNAWMDVVRPSGAAKNPRKKKLCEKAKI